MIPELLAQMSTLEERLNSTVRELQLVKRDNTGIRVLFMFSEYIFQRHRSTNCFFFGMRKIIISQSLLSTVDYANIAYQNNTDPHLIDYYDYLISSNVKEYP